ncbi:MAG: hypothetical protein V4850_17570 [Myxococcota bacterium]
MTADTPAQSLLLIGLRKERLADQFPFPMEIEGPLDADVRAAVANHLASGAVAERYRGHSHCRYGCAGDLGHDDLSDGTWVWPEGFAHYVQHHGVLVPPAFLAHVLGRPGVCVEPMEALQARARSDAIWISWSAQFRTAAIEIQLAAAVTEAQRQCDAALATKALRLEDSLGLSDSACLSAGCTRTAAVGRALCPPCLTEPDRGHEVGMSDSTQVSLLTNTWPR